MLQLYKQAYWNVCIPKASYCNSGNNKERLHKNNTVVKVKMKILWKKSLLDVMKMFHQIYTGCPRRNVPDFGRVFLMLNYTDITQNTYIQS